MRDGSGELLDVLSSVDNDIIKMMMIKMMMMRRRRMMIMLKMLIKIEIFKPLDEGESLKYYLN